MDSFLANLVGKWNLHGIMGDKVLFQKAVGRWVLNRLFPELRFKATQIGREGNPPYEAIYLIGYDDKSARYTLNLFDTSGVTSTPIPGIGKREGNTIRFAFSYKTGFFTNTFTWHPKQRSWTMLLASEEKGRNKSLQRRK